MGIATTVIVFPLIIGTRVTTLNGDNDHDDNDEPRHVAPGSVGSVTLVDRSRETGKYLHHVEFENGCWITLDESELSDPSQYVVQYGA